MKKKLPWLKYDMKKAEYMEAKKREKDEKKKLDQAAMALNELKAPIEYDHLVLLILLRIKIHISLHFPFKGIDCFKSNGDNFFQKRSFI